MRSTKSVHPHPGSRSPKKEVAVLEFLEQGISGKLSPKTRDALSAELDANTCLDDPSLFSQYQSSQRKYFDVYILVPMIILALIVAATRSNVETVGSGNPFFTAAFVIMIFVIVLFIPYFAARTIVYTTPSHHEGRTSYRWSRKWLHLCYAGMIEDGIGIMAVVVVGFYLLGRVSVGQCSKATSIWETQGCNPYANMNSIPSDQVILIYICPLALQFALRGIRMQTLIVCYLLSLFFVVIASVHVRGIIEAWSIMYSFFFLILMFTVERLQRATFMQGQLMIAAIKLGNEHELELLELSSKNEKKMKEKEIFQLRNIMGNVAHDLKSPLHSIEADLESLRVSILNLSKMDGDSTVGRLQRHVILNNSDLPPIFDSLTATCNFMRMAINRSQDFMKASNNIALIPTMEPFELASTLAMSLTYMNHLQTARTIILHPPDPNICRFVISDKQWLSDNILCLLSNAMKFGDNGTVDLKIDLIEAPLEPQWKQQNSFNTVACSVDEESDTSSSPQKGKLSFVCPKGVHTGLQSRTIEKNSSYSSTVIKHMIRISVEDNGVGISEEARRNLFQPNQGLRATGGTGLGLYSLSKRVEALCGASGVSSRADGNHGSNFWFTFPYRPDEVAKMNKICEAVPEDSDPSPPKIMELVRRRSLLVVDDCPTILKVTSRLFRMNGHQIDTATNGSVGLKMLKDAFASQQYDMVLTDLQMPVMDGIEATRQYRLFEEESIQFEAIQNSGVVRRTPLLIVGMSANGDDKSKQDALDSGMDLFISKPFSYEKLQSMLCAA